MPRHCEQYTAVRGLRNHNSVVALQELHIENDVNTLRRNNHLSLTRLVHLKHLVNKATRCVDNSLCLYGILLACKEVLSYNATNLTLIVVQYGNNLGAVGNNATLLHAGLCQVASHTGVVELTVVINNTTLQALGNRSWEIVAKSLCCDKARATITETKREDIVECQTTEVEEILPMAVVRDYEGLILNEVWSILLHQTTLVESLTHQVYLQLLEIANTAVNEFCRTARGTLCKILTLEERNTVTTGCGINCTTKTGCTATYNHKIPHLIGVFELFE